MQDKQRSALLNNLKTFKEGVLHETLKHSDRHHPLGRRRNVLRLCPETGGLLDILDLYAEKCRLRTRALNSLQLYLAPLGALYISSQGTKRRYWDLSVVCNISGDCV